MPVEQRVIGAPQKIGARSAGPAPAAAEPEPEPQKRRRRWPVLVLVLVALVAAGAAAAWFFLRTPDAEAAPPAPEPGAVLQVDPVSLNLADGHYLRLGLGLQLTADVEEPPDPARALDLAIALFSGRPVQEVSDPATRDQLKSELAEQLQEAYEGEVLDVYLTQYVTQ
ncbi:flagellar basal body-associated FliL family protein [Puerhibacterium puerhi]|uniref:flagellar basal body-associated FliL family protein n=1 Tax=Puerhibacterium puerhi TaxID=2692623 RepID=UPI001357F986|nr:flagellar basal body-associated FliL family protein [Puerhibacterium puerhi]